MLGYTRVAPSCTRLRKALLLWAAAPILDYSLQLLLCSGVPEYCRSVSSCIRGVYSGSTRTTRTRTSTLTLLLRLLLSLLLTLLLSLLTYTQLPTLHQATSVHDMHRPPLPVTFHTLTHRIPLPPPERDPPPPPLELCLAPTAYRRSSR